MSDDDKSLDVQLICNQRLVTYNKYQGLDLNCPYFPLGKISWAYLLVYSKIMQQMNPMGLSAPWDNHL